MKGGGLDLTGAGLAPTGPEVVESAVAAGCCCPGVLNLLGGTLMGFGDDFIES